MRGYRCPPHDRQAQAVFQGVRVTQPGPRGGLATGGQPGSGMPLGQRWSAWAPWSMEASRISLPRGGGQLGHGEDGGAELGADSISGSEPSIVRGAVGLRGNRRAGGALNDPACSPISGEPQVPGCRVGVGEGRARGPLGILTPSRWGSWKSAGLSWGFRTGWGPRATHGCAYPCPPPGAGALEAQDRDKVGAPQPPGAFSGEAPRVLTTPWTAHRALRASAGRNTTCLITARLQGGSRSPQVPPVQV